MIRSLSFVLTLSAVVMVCGISYAEDDHDAISSSRVVQGFESSPVPKAKLNLAGKNPAKVGLGSYLVNVGGCSDCHSFPRFLDAGDPFEGTPSTQSVSRQLVANYNVSHFLAGGRCFGPFYARDLTPDAKGRPEGLTEAEFIKVMRTGEDIHCEKDPSDPVCALFEPGPPTDVLQVMPWPNYHSMTDADLKAVYAYLTAIPPAQPCNTVKNGCPGFSGDAAGSADYVYKDNDGTCPNPAPPQ